jgi:hypothetical protein
MTNDLRPMANGLDVGQKTFKNVCTSSSRQTYSIMLQLYQPLKKVSAHQ